MAVEAIPECPVTSKRQLLLIQPVPDDRRTINGSATGGKLYPLGLLTIDALTPKDKWNVEIIDEGTTPFDINQLDDQKPDLVGINSWTNQATRAYRIAAACRQRGIPAILGGPHPSALPEEALQFADSVCVNEAEGVWPRVLADVQEGHLQPIYKGDLGPLDRVPVIKHPLRDKYMIGSVQTARGCPNNCEFCSVTATNGARVRHRPIEDVLDEIRDIKQRLLFVVDDNILGAGQRGRDHALDLCKSMVRLGQEEGIKKIWGTQATHNLGQDNELLEWMYKAGCRLVLFGVESLERDVHTAMNKGINKKGNIEQDIVNTERHGIAVIASFVFGYDEDPPDAFDNTVRFIRKNGVAAQNLNILSPLPGTSLFDRLKKAGRLRYTNFPDDWEEYNFKKVVVKSDKYSPVDFLKKLEKAEQELCNKFTLIRRTLGTLRRTRSPYATLIAAYWNTGGNWHMRDYQAQIRALEEETAAVR